MRNFRRLLFWTKFAVVIAIIAIAILLFKEFYNSFILNLGKTIIPASQPITIPNEQASIIAYYGQIGDFFGGVWGTIIGAITFFVVLGTWHSSRKIDEHSKRYQIFSEMLRTHEEIISSINLGKIIGREALSEMLSEFYEIYKELQKLNSPDLKTNEKIDASFIFMYYGALPNTVKILKLMYPSIPSEDIFNVINKRKKSGLIASVRGKLALKIDGNPGVKTAWVRSINGVFKIISKSSLEESEKIIIQKILDKSKTLPQNEIDKNWIVELIESYNSRNEFGGHQNRLSHYFRNLHGAFQYLQEEDFSKQERTVLSKVLISKLSNYEQALLALYSLTTEGAHWINSGLIKQFMPIKNIPEHFFTFDENFKLNIAFPDVTFEWTTSRKWWQFF